MWSKVTGDNFRVAIYIGKSLQKKHLLKAKMNECLGSAQLTFFFLYHT